MMLLHHEMLVAAATGTTGVLWWILAVVAVNAQAVWRFLKRQLTRFAPKPPQIGGGLTIEDLVRIQPVLDEYITELAKQGTPWTTLAGLIRELNALAMSASALRGALSDTRFRLGEAACLLREPIDFHSNLDRQKIRSARTIIHTILNHLHPEN